jgi:hypothetical protein
MRTGLSGRQSSRRVFTRCPRTGHWLDTGIVIGRDLFDRIERIESQVFCPFCSALHDWNRQSAALDGEFEASRIPPTPARSA